MICFNSGCSFTTPNTIVNDEQMYWYYLAKNLGGTQFINDSKAGSSNDLIIRRVYNHVLSNISIDTFYIINLTSLNRIELNEINTDRFEDILTHDAISCINFEILELTLFTQLIGLISFLNFYKKDFYIINNSKELSDTPYPLRDNFVKVLKAEPRALNLFNNSKFNFHRDVSKIAPIDYKLYGWHGHDGPEGHYAYYKMLEKYTSNINRKQ
jgi:hypothetical protein